MTETPPPPVEDDDDEGEEEGIVQEEAEPQTGVVLDEEEPPLDDVTIADQGDAGVEKPEGEIDPALDEDIGDLDAEGPPPLEED
jgi:hypothetical protein